MSDWQSHVLDNPAWSALTTHQAHLALGGNLARCYPPDLTPIGAVASPDRRALEALADLIPLGDYLSLPATLPGLVPLLPPQLRVTLEKTLVQMVSSCRIHVATRGLELSVLSAADAPEMLALASLTHPGPFRSRTYTLGTYLGIRVDGRLVAMAGQRMHLPGYREISAVCTHPDFEGRGYARTLVSRLAAAVFDESMTPFLHFEEANERAQALYISLGFIERRRLPLLVVERAA